MLIFHSHCQMANQMFMYACAVNQAHAKNTHYCLSSLGNLKYFKLSLSDYLFNNFKYQWYRLSNKLFASYQYLHLQDNFKDYTIDFKNHSANSWYYGYFQGEPYFAELKNEIKNRFEIKIKYQNEFNNWIDKQKLNKNIVAVHIRRSDYKNFDLKELDGPDLTLPFSYYNKLLKNYINNTNFTIIFLSDEIEVIKKDFSNISNAIFSENNAIVDLQILIHADILLLANSSFSWWGAWLNKKSDKKIYVPKYFLGFKVKKEYPINILPKSWMQVEVYE